MSYKQEFTSQEIVNIPLVNLKIVDKAMIKQFPDMAKFYDERADRTLDAGLLESVKAFGGVHDPIKFVETEEFGLIVIDGKQRVKAARACGLTHINGIAYSEDEKLHTLLELSSNLVRSENSPKETATAYKRALQAGLTVEQLCTFIGMTPAHVSQTLSVGEMPKIVHDWIAQGKLTSTAAMNLKKSFGKKAPKGSGVSHTYDDKEVKAALEAMLEEDRLAGGKGKVGVRQAKNSKSVGSDALTGKNWDELAKQDDVPLSYRLLIKVFRDQISMATAKSQSVDLAWLRKIAPQPKPKAEKKAKVTKSKDKTEKVNPDNADDIAALFGE